MTPIRRLRVRLRLTGPARFHFFHGGALHGLLCAARGGHLPPEVVPAAPESGVTELAAGEPYLFGLTFLEPARPAVDRMLQALPEIGARQSGPRGRPPARLEGNFTVEETEELAPLDTAALEREIEALAACERLTLDFLSPLRVERPPELKVKGAGYLNGDCFPPAHFLEALRIRLERLLGPEAVPSPEDGAEPGQVEEAHLLWVDMPAEGRRGQRQARPGGITLGGVVGRAVLSGVGQEWLEVLALGRHLHAGKSTHYALGRYRVRELAELSPEPFRRARSLLQRTAEPERLEAALDHILERSTAPGVDGLAPGDIPEEASGMPRELAAKLLAGDYRPPALLGLIQREPEGKLRPLAVPTVRDRVVQRSAASVLAPAVDTLLEDCSYAYRKGFSRQGAARAIQLAYQEGYRYVLDADIAAFFDSVEWDLLFAKVEALFPLDPLGGLVRAWVTAPVVYEGRKIERTRGLPQGSPVSPLLANLFLDEFDEELLGRDFRLVRYADDFVVLCRDLEGAIQARAATREALEELGLELHEGKTGIRSIDEGFTYLGFLFFRSLVLEEERDAETVVQVPLTREAIPERSWLAQVPFARLRELRPTGRGKGRAAGLDVVTLISVAPGQKTDEQPLYLARWDAEVRVRQGRLVVEVPGEEAVEAPLSGISHVAFIGRTRATLPSLLALARRGVPAYFATRTGRLYATFAAAPADWKLLQRQAEAAGDDALCAAFAREVVAAKLRNAAVLAVRHDLHGYGEASRELRELAKAALNKTSLETLRGLEGRGAAVFFRSLREHLSPDWGFTGRAKHPPPDPVNAMLSFGYTILHLHASSALAMAGLNPEIGLYHRAEGRYHALASDLQEELRCLVDALVIALIHRRWVKPEDFTYPEHGERPVLMTDAFRKRFLQELDGRLNQRFTPPGLPRMTYRELTGVQARQIRAVIEGRQKVYRPLTLKR